MATAAQYPSARPAATRRKPLRAFSRIISTIGVGLVPVAMLALQPSVEWMGIAILAELAMAAMFIMAWRPVPGVKAWR